MKPLFFRKDTIAKIPSETGVYFFLKRNIPLYIGKAVNLRARIASHLRNSELDPKEKQIITQTDRIKIITISSEFNALLYEALLIKHYEPKYNISLKDGKTSLYIKITHSETYPKIYPIRYENDMKSRYFGPFYSHHVVSKLLGEIRRIIPFCSQKKITTRDCFYSKIGLCSPCPNSISHMRDLKMKKDYIRKYREQMRTISLILEGKSDKVMRTLTRIMTKKSQNGQYEEAIIIRERIAFLRKLVAERSFHEDIGIRTIGFPAERLMDELHIFMKKYFNITSSKNTYIIECYDVSHLFGSQATASMVIFHNGEPYKKGYRRFQIKSVHHISDIDMMREVVLRRLKRKEWKFPDLIVLDGGRPQLIAVSTLLATHRIYVPCIGFAKSPDRIVVSNPPKTVNLSSNSALLLLFKYIRDESHRFAKKYHTLLRSKSLFSHK